MLVIESAGMSDVGRVRKGNEDSFYVSDDMRLYVVADGMGGHKAGEVASRVVVETIRDIMKLYIDGQDVENLIRDEKKLSEDAKRLLNGIHIANREVFNQSRRNADQKGMGSTVSAILFTDHSLVAANVGDSPIYLIRNDKIMTLSVPHTVMAEHAALAPAGAKQLGDQFKHMITRAMGSKSTVVPDEREMAYQDGDVLVISSDGLSDKLSPDDILEIAKNGSPQDVCIELVDTANQRGGDDNITVIVLKIKEGSREEGKKPPVLEPVADTPEPKKSEKQISVEYDTEDTSYTALVDTISVKGLFIETNEPFTVDTEIMLTLSNPDTRDSFMVIGKVAARKAKGIEVVFDNLDQEQKESIQSIEKALK
jgi:protein phosphatase